MEEKTLKSILRNAEVPAADENVKKRAINLAVAEFEAANVEESRTGEKNSKDHRGSPVLSADKPMRQGKILCIPRKEN